MMKKRGGTLVKMNEGLNALVILGTAFIFFVMIKSEFSIPMWSYML